MRMKNKLVAAVLAGVIATGCVDLEVQNPNAADTERALRTPDDIEALVASGWGTWWLANSSETSVGPILATVAYQHSATAANFGMVQFSGWPKEPVHSQGHHVYYNEFANTWTRLYRAVAAAVQGMQAAEGVELTASNRARLNAYGYYVLGLAHASSSILFDQGYVYDPSIARVEDVQVKPYAEVNAAAMSYFDKALAEIATARAANVTFSIPATWMSRVVTRDELERMIYSMRARYRAAVARNPTERAAVDWAAVIADVDRGVTADWSVNVQSGSGFTSGAGANMFRYGPWGQLSYQVLGMADQSGNYQEWLSRAPADRHPNLAANQTDDPFVIVTPDRRFPRGSTVADQSLAANRGTLFEIPTVSGGFGAQWNSPARGTFRWSYYRTWEHNMWLLTAANRTAGHKEITMSEMRALKSEGLYRRGDRAGAAALVNVSRTAAGLNATDAAGTNTSCVPKLPDGACGDLWEMLKWEARVENMYKGLFLAPWYFHHRGWGDLAEGVFLHLPVPGSEAFLLGIQQYTFGGPGNPGSAPVGTYGY